MKLAQFLIVPLASARVATRPQIPIVDHTNDREAVVSLPDSEIAPSIGIHFTSSYAVAAARYQNGTIRDLVKVEGGSDYIDLMLRWTTRDPNVERDCYTFDSHLTVSQAIERHNKCKSRLLEHSSRQMSGLPASRDTVIFSNFLKDIRTAIEAKLGIPITTVAPAFPPVGQFLKEDIQESLAIAGLTSSRDNTTLFSRTGGYEEVNAAYATLGQRLVRFWHVYDDCLNNPAGQGPENVLYLNFDNSTFSLGATRFCNPFKTQYSELFGINGKLGWWNMPVFDVPRAEFWERMQEMIMDVIQPMTRPPNKIILMGDHGANEEFKEIVKNALWEKFEFDVEMMLEGVKKEDIGFRAARGAAELGWWDGETQRMVAALQH